MTKSIKLNLTEDEIEMLIDALELDHEGYADSIKESRGNNRRDEVKTYTEAAERIAALTEKLRALIGDEGA
jgi:hypothetical protein